MNRTLPPFPALRAFEAAARHQSFTAAGDELHVTHGAISRQIAILERFVGVNVFDRHGKRVKLNDAGRLYLGVVREMFDNLSVATERLRDSGQTRVLRINALPTFAMRWLLPRLSQFQRAVPTVELRLSTSNLPVDQLEGFDVAVRREPVRLPRGQSAQNTYSGHFLEESEIPVCSPAYLARHPIATALDLSRHVLLHSDTRPDAWRAWLTLAGVETGMVDVSSDFGTPQRKQSFDHFYLALQAAVDGLGVALGPLPLINEELTNGRLVTPLAGPRMDARGYCWVVPREHRGTPIVQQFCRWLETTAAIVPEAPGGAKSEERYAD